MGMEVFQQKEPGEGLSEQLLIEFAAVLRAFLTEGGSEGVDENNFDNPHPNIRKKTMTPKYAIK